MRRTALTLIAVAVIALACSTQVGATGSASYDLKIDHVHAELPSGTGVRNLSVTCPDGGVALTFGADGSTASGDPFYYSVSGSTVRSGHSVVGTFGSDYDDGSSYTISLYADCVSLAS